MNLTPQTRPIALVGLSGAGKSTVAPLLASRLRGKYVDLDARIATRAGISIRELFATRGEAMFRQLEVAELARALDECARVIACGGGIVETEAARFLLREQCCTVWLEVGVPEALRRMGDAIDSRPLLAADPEPLTRMLERREAAFISIAQLRVRTEGLTAAEVAERVLQAVAGSPHGRAS